ncbi:hypothetical protein CAL18_16180 [Bordetella genomosp. 7]|uniref:XRE family transcriptional regulator n=1 Tax=Bordetella genomosp. 7 TaxID=1416805 RepID=UPI000B9DF743|nr:XRE family transcriptional regulator [Bordetella genomosp. 7]OZI16986.1 hypothetical protein CAL18_16180 [Bordetella genomosp. 7]
MSATLRVLRVQSGLTLEELAAQTNLTRSYLSKIERGISTPSISSALRISRALDVPIESLFDTDEPTDSVSVIRDPLARGGNATGALQLVAGASPRWNMLAFVIHPDDARSPANPTGHHDGEELVYVLAGRVELQLVKRKEVLETGDCAHFDSTVPHKISSLSGADAKVLIVISPRKTPQKRRESKPARPGRAARPDELAGARSGAKSRPRS